MAIIDSRLELLDAYTFTSGGTGAVGTAIAGNILDLQPFGAVSGDVDVGAGHPVYLVIHLTTALTQTGTFNLQLYTHTTETVTSGSPIWSYGTLTNPTAPWNTAGRVLVITLPSRNYKRYIGMVTTIGTGAVSAGVLDAYLTLDPPTFKAYPDATN